MKILVINAGSSSLKYQLLDADTHAVLAKGLCERIGIDGHLKHTPGNGKKVFDENVPMPTHAEGIQKVLELLTSAEHGVISSVGEIDAVGHRVVHGGEKFAGSTLITPEVVAAVEECIPLAPLHNPANIIGIRACQEVMPGVPMVAVFDTAFHQTMPSKAFVYALPYEYYREDKVRRYGFHGTSHRFVTMEAAKLLDRPLEALKLISCHLGNGSSICAVDGGKSVDTSMGFTPLAGVPMGTRCGDLDPAILEYLMKRHNLSMEEMQAVLNKKSGVLGISGVSSDFRDLDAAADEGNERAQLALERFRYDISKYIGAYAAAMGGVDAVIFTAGLGENSAETRAAICQNLAFMGIRIDGEKNKVRGQAVDISAEGAAVRTLVIPTNEELMIAMDTAEIVAGKA